MFRLSRFVIRHARLVFAIGLLFGLIGGHFSFQLYRHLRPDLEELLPTTSRSVQDLNEVTDRLVAIDNLVILVLSDDAAGSRRFVEDLVERLESRNPEGLIARVEYRINREIEFFRDRSALYMDTPDLRRVRDYLRERIQYERDIRNPLNIFSGVEIREPKLDFDRLRNKYSSRFSIYTRFPDGFYATPDETKRAVLVYMSGKFSGMKRVGQLRRFIDEQIAELGPKSYAEDLEVRFSGGLQALMEEQQALIGDLESSSIIVTLLVAGALWLFFRSARAAFALVTSLLIATAWTFGIAYFAVGYLNANSAFMGSIIVGNGINFGIIFLARYFEERRGGLAHDEAITQAASHTAEATAVAALAAGLAYGSLVATNFRGFSQFGIIGLIGMVLCWLAAFTVLPALLTLLDARKALIPASGHWRKAVMVRLLTMAVERFPWAITAASLAMTLFSLAMLPRISRSLLETDMTRIRSKFTLEQGSGYYSKFVNEIFQRYLAPVVILPDTREQTRAIAQALKKRREEAGPATHISTVTTLDDFVPKDQKRKAALLREIKSLLPLRITSRMPPEDRARVRALLTPESMRTFRERDIPPLILDRFREKDGSLGKLVVVEPPINDSARDQLKMFRFVGELRNAADTVAPGTPIAGSMPIMVDIMSSITREGPKTTAISFAAVIGLVVLLFRRVKTVALTLFALLLGVLWMVGILLAFQLKINFLNFIALPITFGIGVDYGVNVFQRYRQEGRGGIARVIRDTGGAVGLCSVTTIIGYGSLLIADNRAFVSFGLLAVIGEITCLIAATLTLPALLILMETRPSALPAAEARERRAA